MRKIIKWISNKWYNRKINKVRDKILPGVSALVNTDSEELYRGDDQTWDEGNFIVGLSGDYYTIKIKREKGNRKVEVEGPSVRLDNLAIEMNLPPDNSTLMKKTTAVAVAILDVRYGDV